MTYILYSYPDCASVVIRMALEELGVPYRDQTVDMSVGAHRGDAFLRLNPSGMVPVLADDATGASLAETGAILTFLAEETGRLAPKQSDAARRAAYHQWLHFLSNTLHADAQIQYYTEKYVGQDLAERVRPVIKARLRSHYTMLDHAIADHGGEWLLGDDLSMCDFYLAGCVRWSLIGPRHDPLEPEAIAALPHVSALLKRLERRESVIRAFDAEDTPRSAYFRAPVRSIHTQ